jgi:integrase
MQKKEKIKPTYLTDAVVRGLSKRDIDYFISDTTPGLRIRVWPSGEKVWYFAYRPKGKYPQKIKLDNFRILSVRGARNRVKKTQSDLFNNIDPIESKKQWDDQPTLGEAVKGWYASSLTVKGGYRKNTIKAIKASFGPWIFRKTNDLNIRKHFSQIEDIRAKKLKDITLEIMENFHKTISSKSPYVANRVIQYLKIFFYHAIEKGICNNNPCKIKNKKLNQEIAYDDFLDEVELERVMENAIQKDERTGRLLKSHYKKNKLNPVPCCLLAFQFATARRPHDEASSLKWEQVIGLNSGQCRVKLKQTKTSKHDTPLIFPIADEAHNILKLIATDRLNNPESAFYYPISDVRTKYVFPSKRYGVKTKVGICKVPYQRDVRKTFSKLLKMSGVERHMRNYATRHTLATNLLSETGNLKLVAETLGVSLKTAARYAKVQGKNVVEGVNKVFKKKGKTKLKEVK